MHHFSRFTYCVNSLFFYVNPPYILWFDAAFYVLLEDHYESSNTVNILVVGSDK